MKYNYHTHTARCHHASGTDRQYADMAYKNGLLELGFADHVPQPGLEGIFHSWFRMKAEETEEYFASVRSIKEIYEGKMKVFAGFEVEYYPKHFDQLCEHLSPFDPDYFILGQHFTNNEYDGKYLGDANCTEEHLWQYVEQVEEALKTGMFSYLAHPDLPNCSISSKAAERLCLAAKNEGVPVECNLLGIKGDRWYPKRDFFRVAAEVGCHVILGTDAHSPDSFICEAEESYARKLLSECGITPIEKLELRRPLR